MLSMGGMIQCASKMEMLVGKTLHELKRETDKEKALALATTALESLQKDLERMQD